MYWKLPVALSNFWSLQNSYEKNQQAPGYSFLLCHHAPLNIQSFFNIRYFLFS